jgi:ribosomal protein S18 acetylase RimI-like enzyme
MLIRPFHPADLAVLVDLTIEVFGPFYEESFRAMVPPDVFAHMHGHWADDYRESVPRLHDPEHEKHVLVAEADDGEILGYIGWQVDRAGRHGEIAPLAIRVSARRSGLGRALSQHAMDAMREQDVEVVSLGTGGDWFHAPARSLYESLGFHLVPVAVYMRSL